MRAFRGTRRGFEAGRVRPQTIASHQRGGDYMAITQHESTSDRSLASASPIAQAFFLARQGHPINSQWLRETRAPSGASLQFIMNAARTQLPFLYRLVAPVLLRRDVVMLYAAALAHVHFDPFDARVEGFRPLSDRQSVDTDMLLLVVLGAPEFVELAFGSPWWSLELLDDMNRWSEAVSLPASNSSCDFYYTERAAAIRAQFEDMTDRAWRPDYQASASRLRRVAEAAADGGERDRDREPPKKDRSRLAEDGRIAAGYLRLAQQHQRSFVWQVQNGRLAIASRPNAEERRRNVGPQHATLESLGLVGKRRSKRECALEADLDQAVGSATQEIETHDALLQVRAIIERRRRATKPNSAAWHVLGHFEDLASGTSMRSLAAQIGMDESSLRDALGSESLAIGRELRRA
ncbi:MAG: hypothetical protein JNN27_03520 [Planctomycetes bacterium]|nr:hypothetical protein [Planctomycetota bacterium]